MKKLLVLLLVLWVGFAQAESLHIESFAGGFNYSFRAEDEFMVLKLQTETESARCTVFSEDGNFAGRIELLHTFSQSPLEVTVETLSGKEVFAAKTETVAVEQMVTQQNLLEESKSRKLYDVEIMPLIGAMRYHFRAPGNASLLLRYRSSTERGTVTVYAGENYVYDGILPLPYTYNNSNVVLTVANMKDHYDLYEDMLRTDYPVLLPAQEREGRLSGITVCIDPGHQETAKYAIEERGPGLSGAKQSGVGMARGTVTRRMESIVVLEVGFMLRDALLAEGAAVVMTRETQDTYITNQNRAQIAADAGADFFLRLHGNSRDKESIQGIRIYCPCGSDYAKAIADKDGWQEMCEIMLFAMQNATGQTKGGTALTNQYIGNNWALMPSFLIEMGYMSNPVEDILLSSKPYQRRLVQGMVEGIYGLAVYRGLITI
jgi:N-acetylmuramoyl-L-alanine amidase